MRFRKISMQFFNDTGSQHHITNKSGLYNQEFLQEANISRGLLIVGFREFMISVFANQKIPQSKISNFIIQSHVHINYGLITCTTPPFHLTTADGVAGVVSCCRY